MAIDRKLVCLLFIYLGLTFGILFLSGRWYFIASFMLSLVGVFLIISLFSKKSTFLMNLLLVLYALIFSAELASVYNSGALIEVLTLTNITDFHSVGAGVKCSSLMIMFGFILPIFLLRKKGQIFIKIKYYIFVILGILIGMGLLPKKIKPLSSFELAMRAYAHQVFFVPNEDIMQRQKEIYQKDTIYENEENVPNMQGYNIVTVFGEGLSMQFIDKFNSYTNLTPNISQLLQDSLWFDNYYNHTAATFRGLRGQLGSSYQFSGGWFLNKKNKDTEGFYFDKQQDLEQMIANTIVTVPQILQLNGYHTYFLSAHAKKDKINAYLDTFGFEKVFTADDFKDDKKALTDKELFAALRLLVTEHKLQEPYFIGVYNLGTHIGMTSPDLIYDNQGQTDNHLLNVIHNFDAAFGAFVQTIKEDKTLNAKTAVILTADHAAYPSQVYQDCFADNREHYMGKIPFILYFDGVKAMKIDAGSRNSLDFAPTLLNWLRINHARNYFLGCSLYDKKCKFDFERIFNYDYEFYRTDTLRALSEQNEKDAQMMQKIKDFYHLSEEKVKRD